MLLRHVSAVRGPSSESATDTFPRQGQQNMYQMLNVVSWAACIILRGSYMTHCCISSTYLFRDVRISVRFVDLAVEMCQSYSLRMALWGLKQVAVTYANKVVLIKKSVHWSVFVYEIRLSLTICIYQKLSLCIYSHSCFDNILNSIIQICCHDTSSANRNWIVNTVI